MNRIDPPLPLETPKGPAWAHFLIDYGVEHDLLWVCFLNVNGECWTFRNAAIRLSPNYTMGTGQGEMMKKKPGDSLYA